MTQDLRCIRGNTLRFSIVVSESGEAVDLTGATLTLTAKWAVTDSSAIFTCTAGDGLTITDATNGEVTIEISSSKSSTNIPLHNVELPYDLELEEASGRITTVLSGILKIWPNVTTL